MADHTAPRHTRPDPDTKPNQSSKAATTFVEAPPPVRDPQHARRGGREQADAHRIGQEHFLGEKLPIDGPFVLPVRRV